MLTRRALLRSVLSLAALAPLGAAAILEEIRQQQRDDFLFEKFTEALTTAFDEVPMYFFGDDGVWEIRRGERRKLTSGETVLLNGAQWNVAP